MADAIINARPSDKREVVSAGTNQEVAFTAAKFCSSDEKLVK
jgi:hypothetical protein